MKKILYVTLTPFEYNGSATIRNKNVVLGLLQQGYQVDVLTLLPNINNSNYQELESKLKKYIKNGNLTIRYLNEEVSRNGIKLKSNKKSRLLMFIKRVLKKIFWYERELIWISRNKNKKIEVNLDDYEKIISSSDPKSSHILTANLLKNTSKDNKNIEWIQYWGDPWYWDINSPLISIGIKSRERELIEQADKIVYCSPYTCIQQQRTYSKQRDKMSFVSQPANFLIEAHDQVIHDKCHFLNTREKKKLKVGYFGSYKKNTRNIIPLYNAFFKTEHMLFIVGTGDVLLKTTDNIRIYPKVSTQIVAELEQEMDILVVVLNKRGTQIPGKTFYYTIHEKPILILQEKQQFDVKAYLDNYGDYHVIENNEVHILSYLNEIMKNYEKPRYDLKYKLNPIYVSKKIIK